VVEELVSVLDDEHEIPRAVSNQVISWFGDVQEGLWKMDADAVIRELGIGILRHHMVCLFFSDSACRYLMPDLA
jgi:sister chromatid cohesion protein DCC1